MGTTLFATPGGLVDSQPRARLADVLTCAAIPGRAAALDVGVASPTAANGQDATDAMFRRKRDERENIRSELDEQSIEYQPMVWTHFGRPHAACSAVIKNLAKVAAQKRGGVKADVLERKILAAVSVSRARLAAKCP